MSLPNKWSVEHQKIATHWWDRIWETLGDRQSTHFVTIKPSQCKYVSPTATGSVHCLWGNKPNIFWDVNLHFYHLLSVFMGKYNAYLGAKDELCFWADSHDFGGLPYRPDRPHMWSTHGTWFIHTCIHKCMYSPIFFMLDWMNILGMGVYYGLFDLKQCVKTIILLLQPFLSTLSRDGQSRGFSQGPGWPGWSLPESFVRGYGNWYGNWLVSSML